MSIESMCSGCGKNLSVADEHAGKQARCPACGQIYTVPYPAGSDAATSPFADTSAGPSDASSDSPSTSDQFANPYDGTSPAAEQFWMRAADGSEYGPVDRSNLNRWFQEGRVGPQYQIRQGESGSWQPAEVFKPSTTQAGSGIGAPGTSYASPNQGQLYNYPKPDQSGLILAMGILGFFLCPIFAVVAWIMGSAALKDIAAGRADPRNKGLVQAGYWLGIISVVLNVLCMGAYFVFIAFAIVSNA